jgi:hypothetical protein
MKLFGIEIRPLPDVAPNSAAEVWVTKGGRRMTIGEMDESHAKHALALIMRNVRAGRRLTVNAEDQICFAPPLVDPDALAEWTLELCELRSDELLDGLA